MILVDANVWAYYLDADAKEHGRVQSALPRLLGDDDLLMPTIVQMEVVHYLVRRLGGEAAEAVETFLAQAADIEPLSGGITTEAARLLLSQQFTGIGGRDAALLVTARRRDATILTHDASLARAAKTMGLSVVDPVKA